MLTRASLLCGIQLSYNLILAEPDECSAHDEATLATGALPADLATSETLQAVHAKLAALEAKWTA